jgi:hypothetical protein
MILEIDSMSALIGGNNAILSNPIRQKSIEKYFIRKKIYG